MGKRRVIDLELSAPTAIYDRTSSNMSWDLLFPYPLDYTITVAAVNIVDIEILCIIQTYVDNQVCMCKTEGCCRSCWLETIQLYHAGRLN